MFGHMIPLTATDAFEVLLVGGLILVQSDACGQADLYETSDIVRLEFTVPEGSETHSKFK